MERLEAVMRRLFERKQHVEGGYHVGRRNIKTSKRVI